MLHGRRRIALVAAGAVAAAGIAGGAVAATGGGGEAAGDLASAINERAGTSITADDVRGATLDLLEERLDQAVADGRITRERADAMLERARSAPGLPRLGGPGMRGHGPDGPRAQVMEGVAERLELSGDALRERLRSGSTLAEVAAAEGVTRAQLVATIRAGLVEAGVPAARAAEMAAAIADGEGPGRHRHGPRP